MADETGDDSLRERINELYKEVPKLRIRYAGKTIPGVYFIRFYLCSIIIFKILSNLSINSFI